MEKISCNIIKDLLPNYNDKISSKETNKLVEDHLKTCKGCSEILNNMNKEIENEELTETIDYLKGYRKSKKKAIKRAIILTLITIIGIFILSNFVEFFIDVNEISFGIGEAYPKDEEHLFFYLYSEKWELKIEHEEVSKENGEKIIYLKTTGKHFIGHNNTVSQYELINIDENVQAICIKDKKGQVKEIWNKDIGFKNNLTR